MHDHLGGGLLPVEEAELDLARDAIPGRLGATTLTAQSNPHAAEAPMKEVTCMCGWQIRGTADEVVAAIQEHGEQTHGRRPSREEILAIAVDLGPAGDAAPS
jgi:predicted small metal-binding protein